MAEALQLIDSEGRFNVRGLDEFVKSVHLASCGLSYAVVSIMGPQSSGKSTLLNHLFNTRFTEMNAIVGRNQTTQGVWLAKATGIDPCTLILDLEGTDGKERGEKTAFEKQSSLFALAISDIVLINMWCNDIGREYAANRPLLKTVFQVMMRLFTPRKTTLLFVIRDKTLTPLEILQSSVHSEVLEIWDSIPKPEAHRETPLTEFFNVEVTALSSYFFQKEQFKEDVLQLRQRFANSIKPGGLAGDRRGVIPGTGFCVSTEAIWKVVKDNKDLDLPTHKVMVATVKCEEIAQEKLSKLASDKEWLELDESSKRGPVAGFGKKVTKLVESQITSYDDEAAYFEDSVRRAKRDFLVASFIEIIRPAQGAVVGHHRNKAVKRFKQELEGIAADGVGTFAESVRQLKATVLANFEEGCADASISQTGWEKIRAQFQASEIRDELQRDLESHSASVQAEKLSQIVSQFEERLKEAIVGPAASLLEAGSSDTWPSLRKLLSHESNLAIKEFAATLAGFELDKEEETKLVSKLRVFGRNTLRGKAKEAAGNALRWMRDRFNSVFSQDADSIIRTWTGDEDVRAITKDARTAALKLLSVLAAIRLGDTVDGIENALLHLLGDNQDGSTSGSNTSAESTVSSLLAASSWDGVAPEDTLLTPVQCKDIWRQFKTETQYAISQAILQQKASRRGNSSLPPMWAIVAMVVLGFNEFMALLRNPLYLAVMFVLYLLGKAVWVQLDITAEFQAGFLPGIISVTSKLLPTMMKILKRLADEGQQMTDGVDTNRPNVATRANATVAMQDFSSSASSGGPTSNGNEADSLRQRGKGATSLTYSC